MGTLFYIIGAILKTHPPDIHATSPAPASRAMAGLLYIYVCFYSCGWGPVPWVYTSEIFPTRTRHYGLATGSASQWLWSKSCGNSHSMQHVLTDFCRFCSFKDHTSDDFQPRLQNLHRVRDRQHRSTGYFFIVRRGLLPSCAGRLTVFVRHSLIPETKGRSLEEMDIIFGSITAEERRAHIEEFGRGERTCVVVGHCVLIYLRMPSGTRKT